MVFVSHTFSLIFNPLFPFPYYHKQIWQIIYSSSQCESNLNITIRSQEIESWKQPWFISVYTLGAMSFEIQWEEMIIILFSS